MKLKRQTKFKKKLTTNLTKEQEKELQQKKKLENKQKKEQNLKKK